MARQIVLVGWLGGFVDAAATRRPDDRESSSRINYHRFNAQSRYLPESSPQRPNPVSSAHSWRPGEHPFDRHAHRAVAFRSEVHGRAYLREWPSHVRHDRYRHEYSAGSLSRAARDRTLDDQII